MNKMQFCSTLPAFGSTQRLLAATVLSATLGLSAQAADMYQPPSATPGGVQAQSQITGITTAGSNTTVCWYGMQGWYSVEMSTNNAPPWTSVGTTSASAFSNCLSVANGGNSNAFFRLNQNNAYVGSGGCAGCHGDKFAQESQTRHFSALDTLKKIGMDKNPSCLPCHTVGYGQPTGYTDSTNTSHLSDVGCENCHGPAAWHKYSDHDLIRPAVTIAAETCGGCHDGSHHPTYSEWTNSAHAFVTPDEASTFLPPNTGPARQMTCGPCHSGATRMAMLKNYQAQQQGRTNFLNLPSGHDAATYGPTCVVCHDPHSKAAYSVTNIVTTTNGMVTNIVVAPAQLRNPTFSKDYFTFFTTAATKVVVTTNFAGVVTRTTNFLNDSFTTQYDPSIQVCGQCHNSRGARWDGIGKTWNGTNFVNSTTPVGRARRTTRRNTTSSSASSSPTT
jgi:hypothetical protein